MSGGKMLSHLGWRKNEPWLQEVVVPSNLDWSKSGLDTTLPANQWAKMGVKPREGKLANLPASLLLPQGRKGPAFLAYPNYSVYFEWNKSFVYVTTAAYFANRLEGKARYNAGKPDTGLSGNQMKQLQKKLRQAPETAVRETTGATAVATATPVATAATTAAGQTTTAASPAA